VNFIPDIQMVSLTMSCKARITNKILRFPDVSMSFYTTTECPAASAMSVKHEDGESSMSICKKCLSRYMKRSQGGWYGWFDDVYPKDAPVKGSELYKKMVKLHGEPANQPLDLTCLKEALPPVPVKEALPPVPVKEALPLPVKEALPLPVKEASTAAPLIPTLASLQTIDACKDARLLIKSWIRGEGAKQPSKLQPYYKADMDISAKMKIL
jgi:hypothetical protein